MTNKRYYKVQTAKGTVVRATDRYFLTAVIVDGGEEVTFCRTFDRGYSVRCSKMRFSRDVEIVNCPREITKEEYDAIRAENKKVRA